MADLEFNLNKRITRSAVRKQREPNKNAASNANAFLEHQKELIRAQNERQGRPPALARPNVTMQYPYKMEVVMYSGRAAAVAGSLILNTVPEPNFAFTGSPTSIEIPLTSVESLVLVESSPELRRPCDVLLIFHAGTVVSFVVKPPSNLANFQVTLEKNAIPFTRGDFSHEFEATYKSYRQSFLPVPGYLLILKEEKREAMRVQLALTLRMVSIASFERVLGTTHNFDLICVDSDLSLATLDLIQVPSVHFEALKNWLDWSNVVVSITPVSLNWKNVLKMVQGDEGFWESGGWGELVGVDEPLDGDSSD